MDPFYGDGIFKHSYCGLSYFHRPRIICINDSKEKSVIQSREGIRKDINIYNLERIKVEYVQRYSRIVVHSHTYFRLLESIYFLFVCLCYVVLNSKLESRDAIL